MSKVLIETIYGKHCKYEVFRTSRTFSTDIYLYRDGKNIGKYSSVEAAVKAAKDKG